MATGATGQLGLALPVQGELSGTWGDTVNNGITQYTNIAIAGTLTLTGDGAVTLANTTGDASASNITSTLAGAGTVTAQFSTIRVSGTTATKVVTGPSYSKSYLIDNASSYTVTFKASGQTGVSISPNEKVYVYYNATDYVKVGGGGITYGAVKTTTYTAVANDGVLTNTTSAAFTVNLPATPSTGTQVFIADSAGTWATNNLTIGRNGSTIAGSATDLVCDINSVSIQCVYDGTTWDIFAQIGANDTAVVTLNGTQTLTNKTLTSPTITGTGAIAAATVTLSSTLSVTGGAVVQGMTVGLGAGAVSTNVAVGGSALAANTTGAVNTVVGSQAMLLNTSGSGATAIGRNSMQNNSTGSDNTAVGRQSLFSNTTGSNNVAVGKDSLLSNTTASENTAVGYQSLYTSTTSARNTAVGYRAGYLTTSGHVTAIGSYALSANTTGNANVAVGGNDESTAGALQSNTTGSSNTAIGVGALKDNTTASNNTAVGYQSLYTNQTGTENTALGFQAGYSATGSYNTMLGFGSGYTTSTGAENVFAGHYAGRANTTGSYNVSLGVSALRFNTTASNNTAVGYQTLRDNSTGTYNVSLGMQAGVAITTGTNNIMIGYLAGATSTWDLTTGSNNLCIGGNRTSPAGAAGVHQIVLGTGANVIGKGDSTGFISPNGGAMYNGANTTTWATTSDQRLKKNIVDNNDGLDKITSIRVRNFEYRLPEEVDAELKPTDAIQKTGVQLGVIAQEIQQVLPDCVTEESTGVLSVQTDNLIWYAINAIKEQQAIITTLTERITALEA